MIKLLSKPRSKRNFILPKQEKETLFKSGTFTKIETIINAKHLKKEKNLKLVDPETLVKLSKYNIKKENNYNLKKIFEKRRKIINFSMPYISFSGSIITSDRKRYVKVILSLNGDYINENVNGIELKIIKLKFTHMITNTLNETMKIFISIIKRIRIIQPNWILNSSKKAEFINESTFLFENLSVRKKKFMRLIISIKYFLKRQKKPHIFQGKKMWFHSSISGIMNKATIVYKILGANTFETYSIPNNIEYIMLELPYKNELLFTLEQRNLIENTNKTRPFTIICDVLFFIEWIRKNETISLKKIKLKK